jgi:hypothetical protein
VWEDHFSPEIIDPAIGGERSRHRKGQRRLVSGHECYHCKQWIAEGEPHDCWTTTESALTRDLSEDLHDAWERLRETAAEFGDQRIYASHHSIMFARKSCYFFVRPKRKVLEVCIFLAREIKAPQIRRAERSSKSKVYHILHLTHRDEVEAPVTDWLREAYHLQDAAKSDARPPQTPARSRAQSKPIARKTSLKKKSTHKKTKRESPRRRR